MNFFRSAPFFALAVALAACGGGEGRVAADFSLTGASGRTVSLSGLKGRAVLLNFWATWCDSCLEELPVLEALHRRRSGERFALLAVSVDDDPARSVPPFAAARALSFPLLYADRKTLDAYGVRALPTTFLIAPDGTIARRYVGPLDERAVENDILALISPTRRP